MKPNQISSKIHTSVLVPIEDYKKKIKYNGRREN